MKFMDILKNAKPAVASTIENKHGDDEIIKETDSGTGSGTITEKVEKPEDLLRKANFKIKLVTPTSFGTQIDFAKQYKDEEIENILSSFNIKIKNKSVFIVD